MALAVQLEGAAVQTVQEYVTRHQIDLAEFILQAALEKIEDEHDHKIYEAAMAKYKANPVTYTHAEMKARLGL